MNRWLIAVFTVLLLSLGYWLSLHVEEYTETIDRGFEGEAKTNYLLAAEHFLKKMGQVTEATDLSHQSIAQLKQADVLLIMGHRLSLDNKRSAMLMDWVSAGGHLIITAKSYYGDSRKVRDHILDPLGISGRYNYDNDSIEDDVPIDIEFMDDFWQVGFSKAQVIDIEDALMNDLAWTIETEYGVHGLQLVRDQGRITVLADLSVFNNLFIGRYDHAAFLWYLSNTDPSTDRFYYSLFEQQISLLNWLWLNARYFMLAILMTLLVVIAMSLPRFGPVVHIKAVKRRPFTDHLRAAGNFFWRQGQYTTLLNESRLALNQTIQRKYPEWIATAKPVLLQRLSELSRIREQDLEKALYQGQVDHKDDFLNRIKIIEQLRKTL